MGLMPSSKLILKVREGFKIYLSFIYNGLMLSFYTVLKVREGGG